MKARHRIPAVFSIYMVDVLCCALGCVILLWQLYHQESETQTAENAEIRRLNDELRKQVSATALTIASLSADKEVLETTLASNKKKIIQVTLELDDTRKERAAALALALVRKQELDDMKKT